MKKTILLSVMSAAIFSMSTALAGGGSLFSSSDSSSESSIMDGLYVGGSYGVATTNCMIHDAVGLEQDCDMDGWKAFAGYRFSDMLALEGSYYFIGETDEAINGNIYDPNTGITATSVLAQGEASGFALSGVASYEVIDDLSVFGKLGAMKYTSEGTLTVQGTKNGAAVTKQIDAEVDGVGLLWGIGGSYKITDNIGFRGEYEGFTREDIQGKDQDVGIMSAGVTFSTY